MFYQSFFSPQVKRCAIISYKHGAYKLTHAFRSDNPIILKSLRVILPQKRKTSNFHPRSVHTPNKKEPQNHQFAHRQNAPPEPPTPKTGQMAPRPPKAIMSPPHQRQDKWPPHHQPEAARHPENTPTPPTEIISLSQHMPQTPNKQMMAFFRTGLGKILNWQ